MISVRIRRLHPSVPLPQYQTAGAAGFDLAASEDVVVDPSSIALIPTGLVIQVPAGHFLGVFARSSTPLKRGLMVANGVGVVDSDYSGPADEIKIEVLGSKQQLTVVINNDSMMRHIPPQIAMFIGRAAQGGLSGGPGGPAPGGGPQASGMRPMPQGGDTPRPAPQGGPGGPGGAPGMQRPGMEGGGDFQDMLERMPVLTLADIKPGDVLAVSSTIGADATRLTAITLVTGVEVVLAAMQSPGATRREPNLSTGLPAGVLDMGISRP